jgi:hypothetical protein
MTYTRLETAQQCLSCGRRISPEILCVEVSSKELTFFYHPSCAMTEIPLKGMEVR